jgi:glycosyltransferase involved in cell wall biosynthesis
MTIVHVSYVYIKQYTDPAAWLKKIDFFIGILDSLAKHAVVKSIHCINYEGKCVHNGVEYYFLNRQKQKVLFPIRIHSLVKSLKPDVVIVHGLIYPLQILLLRLQMGKSVKIVVQHHAERPFKDLRKFIQRWADHYIQSYLFCSTEFGKDWVQQNQIKSQSKIQEVMEASSYFEPLDRKVSRELSKVEGSRIYLWVGRLDENKDPITLARAFAMFAKKNPDVSLYMVFQTEELLNKLIDLTKSPSAKIHLVGKVDHNDLGVWYNSADFIISTSHYEGSGIAVCEGLSCGCVPILTNIPSFRMMTDNGKVGILFEPHDEKSLLMALEKSMGIDISVEQKNVLELFKRKLSFDAIAKNIMSVV